MKYDAIIEYLKNRLYITGLENKNFHFLYLNSVAIIKK